MPQITVPGPWKLDLDYPAADWYIINQETNRRKKIGPVGGPKRNGRGTNYRDKAVEECNRRNTKCAKAKESI